jgi:RNA-binding protein Luc7-like 2
MPLNQHEFPKMLLLAGACEWGVHEDHIEYPRVKKEYDALGDRERESLGYERKLYRLLVDLVQEMDKKIARSKERVEKENQPRPIKPADQVRLDALKQQEKGEHLELHAFRGCQHAFPVPVAWLLSQINAAAGVAESTDRAEILAMDGDADGSIAMTEAAEKFREDHDKLYNELVMPERTKSVCEVCGVFINSTDNEQRRLVRSSWWACRP